MLRHFGLLCTGLCLASPLWADEAIKRLPEPLTLSAALAIAAEQSPDVMLAQAELALADAQKSLAQTADGFQARLDTSLGRRMFNGHEEENNTAYLVLQKQLFDFNRTQLNIDASEQQQQAQSMLLELAKAQYRLNVLDAFYGVILADANYRVENEQMAIEYVTLDNAREEAKHGVVSELALLALEEPYQRTLVRRSVAENTQREARARLAELLGYPHSLPEECELPNNQKVAFNLDNIKPLQQKALSQNWMLRALNAQVSAAELKLSATDKMNMPTISAIGRAGTHSHVDTLYEGRWRYDLTLTVPIIDGGIKAAELDKAKANLLKVRAQQQSYERQLRQMVLETALKLDALKARKKQVKVAGDFAERDLDRSRTEYQYERKTDLGDSMVKATRAEYEQLQLARDTAILQAKMKLLLGETE